MSNEVVYNSKVVGSNGEVFMDLTADTVSADKLLSGYTAHDSTGAPIEGTCDFDMDTSGATASAGDVLAGETFGAGGQLLTGTMPNVGAVTGAVSDISDSYAVPMGYHDGNGTVSVDADEAAKLIPENIKRGVEILGVTGDYDVDISQCALKDELPIPDGETLTATDGVWSATTLLRYSATPVKVGTWIDGRDVMQVVYDVRENGQPVHSANVNVTDLNIDVVIDVDFLHFIRLSWGELSNREIHFRVGATNNQGANGCPVVDKMDDGTVWIRTRDGSSTNEMYINYAILQYVPIAEDE